MLRRNLDFLAVALILLGMAIVQNLPAPRGVVEASRIHFQPADLQQRCPLVETILSLF